MTRCMDVAEAKEICKDRQLWKAVIKKVNPSGIGFS